MIVDRVKRGDKKIEYKSAKTDAFLTKLFEPMARALFLTAKTGGENTQQRLSTLKINEVHLRD